MHGISFEPYITRPSLCFFDLLALLSPRVDQLDMSWKGCRDLCYFTSAPYTK
jgi:hypothetical protein